MNEFLTKQAVFTLIDCTGLKTRLYPDIVYRLLFLSPSEYELTRLDEMIYFSIKKDTIKKLMRGKKYNNIKVFETKNIY